MISVRQLQPDDFSVFKQIRLEALRLEPDSYAIVYEDAVADPDREWQNRLANNFVFAAFEGELAVGLIGLFPERSAKRCHRSQVVMVYVTPRLRSFGVAEQLMRAAVVHAKATGLRQLELNCSSENLRAIRFYEREGFRRTGLIPDARLVEGRFVDDVMMMKRL